MDDDGGGWGMVENDGEEGGSSGGGIRIYIQDSQKAVNSGEGKASVQRC